VTLLAALAIFYLSPVLIVLALLYYFDRHR
jgi:hypothetical protein